MKKLYNDPSRGQWVWMSIPFLLVLLVLTLTARAQQGSQGNTTVFGGAQMTLFGNHNFLTGGTGTQPGIIGTVRTAPFGVLNFAASATTTGGNDVNHVDGYVRKYGTTSFIFPTGDNTHYGPFGAAADGTTGAYFFVDPSSAITSNLAGGNYPVLPTGGPFPSSTKEASLSAVSTKEYWDIDGTNATNITLTYSTSSSIGSLTGNDLSKLTIAGWNGTQWVRIPSSVDVTSVLGGASGLVAGSITSTSTLVPNTYTAYTLATYVVPPILNPDNNVAYVGKPITGNLSTNDKVPAGTTYGPATPAAGNPSGGSLTLNPDGTYSFSATTPGSYTYSVPVCAPGQTTNCPTSPLVISTLPDPTTPGTTPAKPVTNADVASVKGDPTSPTSTTVNVLANDKPASGGSLGTPTIVGPPAHGTATIGPDGQLVYTPTPGYYGDDVVTYQVCEQPSGQCSTAQTVVHVLPPGTPNSTVANDDYVTTAYNTAVTGNVKTNDSDPEGSAQTVTAQTTTSPAGSLTLNSDGSFRFVPAGGYSGTASFTYTTCDNASPQACANATLFVLVAPPAVPDLVPIIYALPATQYGTTNFTVVVDVYDLLPTASNGLITLYVTKDPLVNLSFNPGSVLVGGKLVQNGSWTFSNTDPDFYILTTTEVIAGGGKKSFGLTGVLTPGNTRGSLTISTTIVGGSGGEIRIDNDSDADKIDYFKK